MRLLYAIGLRLYYLAALVISPWKRKASRWITGRRNWRNKLQGVFSEDDKVIWMHCASLGEFEQGRPLLELIRKERPQYSILLTFFSPSGYEKRKNYAHADHVAYLPLDTRRNARDFIAMLPIEKAIFIKYEFWYCYLEQLDKKGVPAYLASGTFRSDHLFFRWYGHWFRRMLDRFAHIFVQEETSLRILREAGFSRVSVSGDTRFDRVLSISSADAGNEAVGEFSAGKPVIIAGSTWEKDEQVLYHTYKDLGNTCRWIIAPHETGAGHVERLLKQFSSSTRFTEMLHEENALQQPRFTGADVLIVDTIGHLSSLFRYGTIAYIGGGFGKGIHNLLEPAVYGMPVFFGPNWKRFREAEDLIGLGCGHTIGNARDLTEQFKQYLEQPDRLKSVRASLSRYFSQKSGATATIFRELFESE